MDLMSRYQTSQKVSVLDYDMNLIYSDFCMYE